VAETAPRTRIRIAESGKVDEQVDRLYALPVGEFTAARNALAKELRSAREREAAERVRALKRPTAAAGALNRLWRERPAVIRRVLRSGERVRAAQEQAIGGGSGRRLREAASEEREAVADAAAAAADYLGVRAPAASLDRVAATLRAAATDEGVRRELEQGRVTADHEAIGLGASGATATGEAVRRATRGAGAAKRQAEGQRALRTARDAERKARKRVATATTKRDRLRQQAERVREELDAAERALGAAERDARDAAEALERARETAQAGGRK
jgi:hypothetical protein